MNLQRNTIRNALLAAVLTGVTLTGCTKGGADDKATSKPATTQADKEEGASVKLDPAAVAKFGVVAKKVYAHVLDPTFTAPARVAFNSELMATVSAPVPGRVQEVMVKLGDQVKTGAALAVVLSSDLGDAQSDYLLKHTAARSAAEVVAPAMASYDRAKSLLDQSQGISLSEVQKREVDWKTAVAAQKTADEAFNASTRKLHLLGMDAAAIEGLEKSRSVEPRYTVRAPIDGRVIERNATLGQQAGPDKDSLFTLADTTSFWIIADVPEGRLPDVEVGRAVRVTAAGLRGQAIEGKVAYVGPAIDPATRSVQVRVALLAAAPGLKPGMFAEAEFDLPTPADAEAVISVPESAVQTVDGKPAVFVLDDEDPNTFQKRDVIVGPSIRGMVPLLFGVKPREKVVVSGAFILKAELGKPAAD